MKTSIVLVALVLNTVLLFAEPLSELIQGINPWVFAISEAVLLVGYLGHRLVKDLKKTFDIDLDDFRIFIFKDFK
ncbi:MAG: hypothetical protein ACR2MT_03790 [Aurantibacter sp.]